MKIKLHFFIICLCFIIESNISAQVSFPSDYFKLEEHEIKYPQITQQMFDTLFSHYKPEDYSVGAFRKYPFLFKLYDTTIFDNLYLVEISNLCAHKCQRIYAINKASPKIIKSADISTFNQLIKLDSLDKFDQAISWMILNDLEYRIILFEMDSIKFAGKSRLLSLIDVTHKLGNVPDTFFDSLNYQRDTIHIILFNSKANYIEKYFFSFNDDGVLVDVFKRSYLGVSPFRVSYLKKQKRNR